MPIQQMLLGVGGKKKIYSDDLFSNYAYTGTGSAKTITNGIDLAGEGGLVWTKCRTDTFSHSLMDTVRGTGAYLKSESTSGQSTDSTVITAYNNNGYTLGTDVNFSVANKSGDDYTSWTFRKAPGFFDVQTYTGGGANTSGSIGNPNFQVNHDLGCIPGMILIKRTNSTTDWLAWHKGEEGTLNSAGTLSSASALPLADVTDTYFKFAGGNGAYNDPGTFVAYLFAGGESTAATARSVDFTGGSGNYLQVQSTSSDLEMGSSDFTLEMWINSEGVTSANKNFFSLGNPVQIQQNVTGNKIAFFFKDDGSNWFINNVTSPSIADGTWNHVALTRSGNTWRFFLNGTQFYTGTHNVTVMGLGGNYPSIGSYNSGSNAYGFDGKISNVRFVKGTAVYTSSFRPPTEPLTNITNTKLLCCNNSSVTGSTVSPGTLAQNGHTASTDSPFDDPAGFVFGGNGDQNAIKCGEYIGNGSSDGPEVFLGWEPQWLVTKCATNSTTTVTSWNVFDNIRGASVRASKKKRLWLNGNWAEDSSEGPEFTSYGFKIADNTAYNNEDGETYIYMAIRRNDGYIGKPIDTGTDVFAMDTGAGSSTIPNFDSGFPVDMAFYRAPASSYNPWLGARIMEDHIIQINSNAEGGSGGTDICWDSNAGWQSDSSHGSTIQSWMWKRHAGFDVVNYKGTGTSGNTIPHSLSKSPEMMWIKKRDSTVAQGDWVVYHKGLDGGTNPETHYLLLNSTDDEADANYFDDQAPTSTHFIVGGDSDIYTNRDGSDYLALLFASVAGVSKVGSYDGSNSAQTITTGFQPRFLIVKRMDTGGANLGWYVFDTTRGWGSGDDKNLYLEDNAAQGTHGYGAPTSTGFTWDLPVIGGTNTSGGTYLYYAHA